MPRPKVSVIVPAYNVETYIGECLADLLVQSERQLEILVVDDGSSDGTAKIIEQQAKNDPRIKLLKQANAGVSAARNAGLERARGQFIAFVDSDDRVAPNYLSELLARIGSAEIATCRIAQFRQTPPTPTKASRVRAVEPMAAAKSILYGGGGYYWSGPGAKLYRAELLEDERFDEHLRYSEDLEFFLRVVAKSRAIVTVDFAGYYYRLREGSATQSGFTPAVYAYREQMERHFALPRELKPVWQTNLAYISLYYLSIMPAGKYGKYRKLCKENIRRYRLRAVLDPRQRINHKLAVLGTFVGIDFAARLLVSARQWRDKRKINA